MSNETRRKEGIVERQLSTTSRTIQRLLSTAFSSEDFVSGMLPCAVLLFLVVWLGILQPGSLSGLYVTRTINLTMVLILVAVGQTVVVLTGGIDLSVGGLLSVINVIAATQMGTTGRVVLTAVLLIALGWVPGFINGALIVHGKLQPFIVTLAAWFVWAGVALFILPKPGGIIEPSLAFLSTGRVLGIGMPFWWLLGVVLFGVWFPRTRLGLEIKAVGSNREGAFFSGIRISRSLITAYSLSSLFTVLSGILLSAQSLSGDPTVGQTYILPSVAATVIGGTSLFGGSGNITSTVIGAIVLSYVVSVVFALGLDPQWGQIAQGLLLVLAVWLQFLVRKAFGGRKEA